MKTIPPPSPPPPSSADILLLLATLRARIEEDDVPDKDAELHQRSVVALSAFVADEPTATTISTAHKATTATKVAMRLGGGLSLYTVIDMATSGLGPYFRLVAASKSVACPRCLRPVDASCEGAKLCDERTWAFAAQRRRDKHPLAQADILTIHHGLQAGNKRSLDLAIKHGLVRLERAPCSDTEVQWVDAA